MFGMLWLLLAYTKVGKIRVCLLCHTCNLYSYVLFATNDIYIFVCVSLQSLISYRYGENICGMLFLPHTGSERCLKKRGSSAKGVTTVEG